jgi:hypothetical protein
MSILIHRCTRCGHPDIFSGVQDWSNVTPQTRDADCSHRWCRPCVGIGCVYDAQPEGIPTWHSKTGALEPLRAPGSRMNSSGSVVPLCGCEECHAAYTAITEGVPA